MTRKKAPPHPGEVLRDYLGDVSVTEAARKLAVSRSTLSRILHETSGVSADMAIRLGMALDTSSDLWAELQWTFDLYQASKRPKPKVGRIATRIKDKSILELKGMLRPPAGVKVSTEDMRRAPEELAVWENVAPVGREFGSPDYERLEELDGLAFKAFGSMKKARRWLDFPHVDLGGLSPEQAAKTAVGLKKVKHLLRVKLGS
jgi:addiction module HigA family antidote